MMEIKTKDFNLNNKFLIIDLDAFQAEMRVLYTQPFQRVVIATGGFGCQKGALGKIYANLIHNGQVMVLRRRLIERFAEEQEIVRAFQFWEINPKDIQSPTFFDNGVRDPTEHWKCQTCKRDWDKTIDRNISGWNVEPNEPYPEHLCEQCAELQCHDCFTKGKCPAMEEVAIQA